MNLYLLFPGAIAKNHTRWLLMASLAAPVYAADIAPGLWNQIQSSDYTWSDDQSGPTKLKNFAGQYLALSMFYTNCERTCPMTIASLKRLEKQAQEHNQQIEFVLVSLDPKNDTQERLSEYRKSNQIDGKNWHLLKGDESQTEKLANILAIGRDVMDEHILHNLKIHLFGPDGKELKVINWENR